MYAVSFENGHLNLELRLCLLSRFPPDQAVDVRKQHIKTCCECLLSPFLPEETKWPGPNPNPTPKPNIVLNIFIVEDFDLCLFSGPTLCAL